MPEQTKFCLPGWARHTMRGPPVTSLSVGLCLPLSRICSGFCLWVLQGGAGAEAPSGVQTRSGAQAAVLPAASGKSYEFRSVPAFLVSLLLLPMSETLSACAICSTKSIASPLQRDESFCCSLCCCTVISACCAALAHVATKMFSAKGLRDLLWILLICLYLIKTFLLGNCSEAGFIGWYSKVKRFTWGSAIHHLQLLSQLCEGFVPAQLWWHNLMSSSEDRAGTGLPKMPLAGCTEAVSRKGNDENGTDFTWVCSYRRKLTVLVGLCWHCRADR